MRLALRNALPAALSQNISVESSPPKIIGVSNLRRCPVKPASGKLRSTALQQATGLQAYMFEELLSISAALD
ncbi:hypothetical protein Vi05172_g8338 [Venturia inaequalis]|nr:hypothetical protein Vi05172_g8338 [Venturia inaequalis]